MRRLLLAGLVIAAVAVYAYDTFLLVWHPSGAGLAKKQTAREEFFSIDKIIAGTQPVSFVKCEKNPFTPRHEYAAAPKVTSLAAGSKVSSATAIQAPDIKINGIMGDQSSPLVMLTLPDGSTAAVMAGQSAGEFLVKKIEKDRILIIYQKNSFWISR